MSKQYLTTHTVDDAHPTDIFSLAATSTCLISASGSSSIKIYSTASSDFPLLQTLTGAHPLGCHHVTASANGTRAASIGFGGEVKIWAHQKETDTRAWTEEGKIIGAGTPYYPKVPTSANQTDEADGNKAGELWALAMSEDGQFLASTTYDGRISVWDLSADRRKIREYETKGSFGMCIDMSRNGELTASGHVSGSIYVFANSTGRLRHSLLGLIKPVRSVRFSPGSRLLAAAGDARVIGLYDPNSGEQVALLTGHGGWIMSLDWSHTGEYLLSGSWDGKVKVWSVETRTCVATHSESEKAIWSSVWLPKVGRSEGFAVAGAGKSIRFYREAAGS